MSFPLGSHIEQKTFHFHSLISLLRTICLTKMCLFSLKFNACPQHSFWWSATLVSVRTLGKDWPRWLLKMASASLFVAWMPSVSSGETSRRSTPPCPGLAIRPIRRPRWYGRLPFQHPDAPNGQSGGSPLAATPEGHQVARNAHLLAYDKWWMEG